MINTRIGRGPTPKQYQDALNPLKFIYRPEEKGDALILPDVREEMKEKEAQKIAVDKLDRVLAMLEEVLSLLHHKK